MLQGNVLVTGGAGFLGRGLLRRARRDGWPINRWTVLSRDDAKHAALQAEYADVDTVLGDVGLLDVEYLAALFRGHDVIIHAAASKYVDRSEHAAVETFRTNYLGTWNVAQAALRARVSQVIGISTDKACMPVNNYGASKFAAERVLQEANRLGDVRFTACRYGNVIGSTGSVLTIWQRSIDAGEPLRLTDPLMTRFWMTVDEAIDCIGYAATKAASGSVVVPSPRAMQMKNLARMALGYVDDGPLPESVDVIGIRPGEKRHEMMIHEQESVRVLSGVPGGEGYFQIRPPDSAVTGHSQSFKVVSSDPPGGWMGTMQMREAVADARALVP